MQLEFSIHGRSCDMALHPVSPKTAELIREKGSEIYKDKVLRWWRNGSTCTWGMKIDDECHVLVTLDGKPMEIDLNKITATPMNMRRRKYLNSSAKYLCLFGYDNETCKFIWTWDNVKEFDPGKFEFMVHNWDRLMDTENYNILDEIRYDGQFANRHDWCEPGAFTLIAPRLFNLDNARREWGAFDEKINLDFPQAASQIEVEEKVQADQ